MKRPIEVESRFQVIRPEFSLDIHLSNPVRIVDTYYDTQEGQLYKQGIFLRNRNTEKLDFKFNLETVQGDDSGNDHTHCDEYSFHIPFKTDQTRKLKEVSDLLGLKTSHIKSLKDFLKENKFISLVVVDKSRQKGEIDSFEICLDSIKGVGTFMEIEKMIQVDESKADYQDKLEKVKQDISSLAKSLGIETKPFESGYVELILAQKNRDLYLQGQYLMDKDK